MSRNPQFNQNTDAPVAMSTMFYLMALNAVSRAEVNRPTNLIRAFVEPEHDKHVTHYACEAVIMAVTTLEAAVNEIGYWKTLGGQFSLPPKFEWRKLDAKYKDLPKLLGGKSFNLGARPFQDLKALLHLRNALVHFKWDASAPAAVMRFLAVHNLAMQSHDVHWRAAALTNKTAQWSVETARKMIEKLVELAGIRTEPHFVWGDPNAFRPWTAAFPPCPAVHEVPLRDMRHR
jgi:hypothetical protein